MNSVMRQSTMPLSVMGQGKRAGLQGYRSPLNYLLPLVPLGIVGGILGWAPSAVFLLNFCGCIPLATILGRATEDVAEHTNETIGGLINATFGNAVELILSIVALRAGNLDVVRNTLVGSILSNLLLVLGSSLFFGGLIFREQEILPVVVENNSLALGVSLAGFVLPTLFSIVLDHAKASNIQSKNEIFSLVTSILMLVVYACYLFFQLYTHADFFDGIEDEGDDEIENVDTEFTPLARGNGDDGVFARDGSEESEADDDNEIPPAPMKVALTILVIDVAVVAVCCEFLVGSIDGFATRMHLGTAFVAVILLPVIGNAVEHLSAVMVAMKNKMDLSVGIACGSSVQIAMFAAPLMVVVSWVVTPSGVPRLTLDLDFLDLVTVGIAVFTANLTLRDASTNWLEGASLIMIYLMIGTAFYIIG